MAVHAVTVAPGAVWPWVTSWVHEQRVQNPLAPISIVTPTTTSERLCRWRVSTAGLANVHILSAARLLNELNWLTVAHPQLPTSYVDEWVYADRCLAHAGLLPDAQPAERASFAYEAVRLHREARLRDDGEIGIRHPVMSMLVMSLAEALAHDNCGDLELCARSFAASRTTETDAAVDAHLGTCLIVEPPPERWANVLVTALAERSEIVSLSAQQPLHAAPGGHETMHAASPAQPVRVAHSSVGGGGPLRVRLIAAGDPVTEVCALVRALMDDPAPLHSMGIAYADRARYRKRICDLLDERGIPWESVDGVSLAELPGIACLEELCRIAEGGFPWDDTIRWLQSILVTAPQLEMIERLLWTHRATTGFASIVSAVVAAHADAPSELSDELLTIVNILAKYPAITEPATSSVQQWVAELTHLFSDLIVGRTAGMEQSDVARVSELLEHSARLAAIHPECPPAVMRLMLHHRLSTAHQSRPYRGGVIVGSLAEVRDLGLSTIGVCGCIEGEYPARYRASGVERERVAEARLRAAFDGEQQEQIRITEGTAHQLILTYPEFDGHGRPLHPSPWYSRWADLVAHPASGEGGAHITMETVSDEAAAMVPNDLSTSAREHETARYIQEWTAGGHRLLHRKANMPSGAVGRSRAMQRSRYAQQFTTSDGNLSKERLLMDAYWKELFEIAPVSSTQLQEWATCPMRYFLHRVLHLPSDARYGLDDEWSASPADFGTLLHSVLERYYRENASVTPDQSERAVQHTVHAILDSVMAGEGTELIPHAAVRQFERARLQWLAVRQILSAWRNVDDGFRPAYFEQPFGYAESASWDEITIPVPNALPLRVRGKIDRIDIAEQDGRIGGVRVIDYKSGTPMTYKDVAEDPLGGGTHIQGALYSAAAKTHFAAASTGLPPTIEAAYWFIGEKGQGTSVGFPYTSAIERETHEVIEKIASEIHQGIFPAVPGEEQQQSWAHCRNCPYDLVCPQQRDRMQELKVGDPLLARFGSLTGGHSDDDRAQESGEPDDA